MIFSDVCHKYHASDISKFVKRNFTSRQASEIWGNFEVAFMPNITYNCQIMLLFVYTTTRKGFVIFTCIGISN